MCCISVFFNADLVVARSEDDKNIYICGKKMSIVWQLKKMRIVYNISCRVLNSRSRGLTESVMSSSRKCKR